MKIEQLVFKSWVDGMDFIEKEMQIARHEHPNLNIPLELDNKLRDLENLIKGNKSAYHSLLTYLNEKFIESKSEFIHSTSHAWNTGIELFMKVNGVPLYFNMWNHDLYPGLTIDYIGPNPTSEFWMSSLDEMISKTKEYVESKDCTE